MWPQPSHRNGVRRVDVVREAVAALVSRPIRTVLTVMGTIIGTAGVVAVLGLSSTASGQISQDLDSQSATTVEAGLTAATPGGITPSRQGRGFPPDVDTRLERIRGVLGAGRSWSVSDTPLQVSTAPPGADREPPASIPVRSATPGFLRALAPTMTAGHVFGVWHERAQARVVVLGAGAATQLGLTGLGSQPTVFLNGVGYTVIGIMGDTARFPASTSTAYLPTSTTVQQFGPPTTGSDDTVIAATAVGAAPVVAKQIPLALRPDDAAAISVTPPPTPHLLQDRVSGSVRTAFLAVAALILLVSALGVASTTTVAVLERSGEIGLRRALGATSGDIAAQLLLETGVQGLLGGLVGAGLGIAAVLAVAVSQSWTAVVDPAVTLVAPALGSLVGVLAGTVPAWRAVRLEPVEALRRGV